MTISVAVKDPVPGARDVSRLARPRLSLASDDVSRPVAIATVDIWFNGAKVVDSGEVVDGRSTVSANGLSGYDIVIVPVERLAPDETCTVRVTADDTVSSSPVDESWLFSTIEDVGPRINQSATSPEPGGNPSSSPATITVTVSDALVLGLDVVIDGVSVVENGSPVDWGAVVTPVAGGVDVTVTPPSPWSDGRRVPVFVRAADADGDVSELSYDFLVGQEQGPVVGNISPAPGTRGMPIGPGPTSDLAFRVTSVSGVLLSSVNVLVDGTSAVASGVGVGTYAASTLTPVSGGYDVVLKNSVSYGDGRIVHVDVSCTDTVSRPGERRVWSVQFGDATGSVAATQLGGEIPSDDVVRVCAYDLSDTSFCRPAEMRHTGYAADGYWYEQGTRTQDVASWFTELGQFPAGGQLVVMSGHWALLPALAPAPWAQCQQLVSGDWNMAGKSTSPLLDGDFSPRHARFALASALGVITVDFTTDRATLIDAAGRMAGAWGISQRAINQASGDVDGSVTLDASASQRLALDGDVVVVCQAAALSVVRGDESRTQAYSTSWARVRVDGQVFAVAYNDLGQGAVEIWSLDNFFSGSGMSELYDDMSSPAVPAAEINDIDIRGQALFTASDAEVTVIDRQNASAASYTAADLGLTGTGNISSVSSLPGSVPGYGYFYAGTDGPGRVTRFRIHWPGEPSRAVTVSDGVPVSSLSAFGAVEDSGDRFMRLAMRVIGDTQAFVNSSMDISAATPP